MERFCKEPSTPALTVPMTATSGPRRGPGTAGNDVARPPRQHGQLGARVVAAVGVAAAAGYLAWRVGWSWGSGPWWLSVPTLAIELAGFAGALALLWALWPQAPAPIAPNSDNDHAGAVDAVVRVGAQAAHDVRATVLALRAAQGVGTVTIVDVDRRPELAALAAELGTGYVAIAATDLPALARAGGSEHVLVLDAGDIPTTDIVTRLLPHLADERVAVVQGLGTSYADDSPEHGPNQRHELLFERAGLNPALGRRGVAIWTGSGSIVRASAVRAAGDAADTALGAHWAATASLFADGWQVTAPGVTVFAQRSLADEAAVLADRTSRARSARRLLLAPGGALRRGPLRLRHRAALVAWAVRPLSGLRRLAFIAVLCGALLSGHVPFVAPTGVIVGLWLPGFCYLSLGLALLSGWTVRPGDRTRWSLHTLGPAWSGLRSGFTAPTRPLTVSRAPYAAGVTGAVVAISVVLALRGLSERATHTLGTLPQTQLLALVVVSLWTLGLALDVLRVLVRSGQLRRSPRVAAGLPAVLGERGVSVADLTPLGAGVVSHTGLNVGERLVLETSIPTRTGITAVRVPCVVRNVVQRGPGEWRVGVEFAEVLGSAADALAEYCSIEPSWERMGSLPCRTRGEARPTSVLAEPLGPGAGRLALRAVSLVAVVGAVGSALPATADAAGVRALHLSGVVVETNGAGDAQVGTGEPPVGPVATDEMVDTDEPVPSTDAPLVASETPTGVPGALVWAVCSLDPGADGQWGTADDTYGPPVSVTTAADGSYDLMVDGVVCWATVAPPEGYLTPDVETDAPPQPVPLDEAPETVHVERVTEPGDGRADGADGADGPGAGSDAGAPASGSLGDLVWLDLDGDGLHGTAEPGAAGVRVALLDRTGAVVDTTATDGTGRFLFDGLTPGAYRLAVSDIPSDMRFAVPGAGTDAAQDSDADAVTGRTAAVAVEGARVDTVDVGLRPATAVAAEPAAAADQAATAGAAARILPPPGDGQMPQEQVPLGTLALVVLALAGLMAASIVLGVARPPQGSAQVTAT